MDVSGFGVVDGREGRAPLRQRPALRRRGEQREVPCCARVPRRRLAGGRDAWRFRLRQGISCRAALPRRSEERPVGKACVSTFRSRLSPCHSKIYIFTTSYLLFIFRLSLSNNF